MRILVAGRSGQLAHALVSAADAVRSPLVEAPAALLEVVALGRPHLDLSAPHTLAASIARVAPDVVVNAAAYTAVDQAETEPDAAFAINAQGAGALAAATAEAGIPLIHLSTDYVFDGSRSIPYVETDPVAPLGVYGHSKLEGEQRVRAANPQHLVVRTSWVVSPWGANFVKTMLRLAASRSELGVVDDQHGSPTYAPHLADAIIALARRAVAGPADAIPWGIYHASGSGEATWCDLAREVFRLSRAAGGPAAEVRAITTADFPTPARRPANSRLDCNKLQQVFGLQLPHWKTGIAACVGVLLENPPETV